MSWEYYTRLLDTGDDLIPKEWVRELHAAIEQRRAFAGLSMPSFSEDLPRADYWTLISELGEYYADPTTRAALTGAILPYVTSELGYTPDVSEPCPTRDFFNACRVACDLFTFRRFVASSTIYRRWGRAAGVTEDVANEYLGEDPVSWPSSSYGASTWAGSKADALARYAADGAAPENNPENITGQFGTVPYATLAGVESQDIPDYPDSDDFWHLAGKVTESSVMSFTVPTALQTALGVDTLDFYGSLRHADVDSVELNFGAYREELSRFWEAWSYTLPYYSGDLSEDLPGSFAAGISIDGGSTVSTPGVTSSYVYGLIHSGAASFTLELKLDGDPIAVDGTYPAIEYRQQIYSLQDGLLFADISSYLDLPAGELP